MGATLPVMALASALAMAHGEPRSDLRVVLDGVKPPVAGLRVQVFDDHLAPQLVLENSSGRVLEILDENNRAFVKIGPGGVQADLAAAAWYETLSPGGTQPPERARAVNAEAQWRAVRKQTSWGWFDRRLDKDGIEVPHAIQQKAQAVKVERWSVSLRLGGQALVIEGHFLYQPRPAGVFQTRLLSSGEVAPKVRVTLSPGQPPALLLENLGDQEVIVLGAQNEPFVRIRPDGVDGNLSSPTWQDLGRYKGLAEVSLSDSDAPRWQRVSLAPRYSWIEPRAGAPSFSATKPVQNHARSKVKGWQVPILVNGQSAVIAGVVEWAPLPAAEPISPH